MTPISFYLAKIEWFKHWTNGGTGISNYADTSERGLNALKEICASVEAFNDPTIFMMGVELHCSEATAKKNNMSAFWDFHKKRTTP